MGDATMFTALAQEAKPRLGEFNLQGLTSIGWAFATACGPVATLLNPISVLDGMTVQVAQTQVMSYQMSMERLAATGWIIAGFALVARFEASIFYGHNLMKVA